jgi:pyruvate formate lyase activating enzyme
MNIFEIERYAVDDGPGIRTVVFLKGCNLRCRWCQNPESFSPARQVMFHRDRCVACGRCVTACPVDAIRTDPPYQFVTDHDRCIACGACVDACFTGARTMVGQVMTPEEVMRAVLRDRAYYRESAGGVTFSGGEPLLQSDALADLARRCHAEGIHTAVETAGNVPWSAFATVLPHVDLVLFDLKHIDSEAHLAYTGVPLDRILENIRRIGEGDTEIVVRVPVIPGVNASEDVQRRLLTFLAEETAVRMVQLLPFHRLGTAKYDGLGLNYAMSTTGNLRPEDCAPLERIARSLGLIVYNSRDVS